MSPDSQIDVLLFLDFVRIGKQGDSGLAHVSRADCFRVLTALTGYPRGLFFHTEKTRFLGGRS
jgi:hypothetical protein